MNAGILFGLSLVVGLGACEKASEDRGGKKMGPPTAMTAPVDAMSAPSDAGARQWMGSPDARSGQGETPP